MIHTIIGEVDPIGIGLMVGLIGLIIYVRIFPPKEEPDDVNWDLKSTFAAKPKKGARVPRRVLKATDKIKLKKAFKKLSKEKGRRRSKKSN